MIELTFHCIHLHRLQRPDKAIQGLPLLLGAPLVLFLIFALEL